MTRIWQKDAFNSSVYIACSVLLHMKSGLLWWSLVDMSVWCTCWDIPICLKRIRGRLGSNVRFLPSCYLELVLNPCLQIAWSEVNLGTQGDTWGTMYIHSSEGSTLSRGNIINIKESESQHERIQHFKWGTDGGRQLSPHEKSRHPSASESEFICEGTLSKPVEKEFKPTMVSM